MAIEIGNAPIVSGASLGEDAVPKGTSEGLAKVFTDTADDGHLELLGSEEDKPSTNQGKEPADATPATDTEKTVEEPVPVEPSPETEGTDTTEAAPTIKIPAAHVRSLKAYGYTDDEIKELEKAPNALRVSAKIHETRNAEMAKWAEIGRKSKQGNQAQPPVSTPAKPAEQTVLKPIDIEALKKVYGDEAIVQQLTPVNQAIEQLNKMFPVVQAYEEQQKRSAQDTLNKQIDGFFGAKDMKDYHDTYGTVYTSMTSAQEASRIKVLEQADALMYGARIQGRDMSVDEALSLAHELTTAGQSQEKARTEIASQLKTREKGMTLKPAGRKGDALPAKDNKELRSKVKGGLAKAFS